MPVREAARPGPGVGQAARLIGHVGTAVRESPGGGAPVTPSGTARRRRSGQKMARDARSHSSGEAVMGRAPENQRMAAGDSDHRITLSLRELCGFQDNLAWFLLAWVHWFNFMHAAIGLAVYSHQHTAQYHIVET